MSSDPHHWETLYAQSRPETLPWNAGGPDPDLVRLVKAGEIPRGQALDIGTGPGHDAVFLIQQGFDVIAIDISPTAVVLARENASHAGLFGFFQEGDLLHIPVEDQFIDFAYDRGCFHVLPTEDHAQAVNEVHRVLKPGGRYLLRVFSDKEPAGAGPHRFTRKELEDVFSSTFKILKLWDGVFDRAPEAEIVFVVDGEEMKRRGNGGHPERRLSRGAAIQNGSERYSFYKGPPLAAVLDGRRSGRPMFWMAAALLFLSALPSLAARVQIREGRFYVDNEPFYARGIGYAPWRPHQHPGISYTDTNRHWTKLDFERMKAAHFNTVRTWDALDPEELSLAKENGLMVLQGIWLDTKQDFSDPRNQQAAIAEVQSIAENSKASDNILGYLIMTEPVPEAVLETGQSETLQFFRRLKRAIQAIDPRPVSMDSWPPLAFMDHRDFDFSTFNLFAFWPNSLTHAMGLAGMTRWFADHIAQDTPLIVGETGGYSVSEATQTAAGGAGGFTEYKQSLKDLDSLRATVEGHAAGSVLVSWIDTWHYPKDPDSHDNEPWEWDGILAIATDSEKDMEGIPRQVYKDVSAYNQVIPIEPKTNHIYPIGPPVPIQVNAADDVTYVRYSLNDGDWTYLDGSGHGWFQGFFKLPKLAKKRQTLNLQALGSDETVLARKEVSFLAGVLQESLTIEPKNTARESKGLDFTVKVEDSLHHPIAQRKVDFGCFEPIHFGEQKGTVVTDTQGTASFSCLPITPTPTRYLYVAAGTNSPEQMRFSDMRIFSLKK